MKLKLSIEHILLVITFTVLVTLFTYKLGNTALSSYDEAWYADITRNLVASKNPFSLTFNGSRFTDHPPFGYVLMAVPIFLLGSSEFAVRVLSAVMGAGTIILVYFIGKRRKDWSVGVGAGLILLSSLWFMVRTRSGNLDIPFVFWEVLTVYLLIGRKKLRLWSVAISFAALVLTKTLVGFGLLPLIILVLLSRKKEITTKQILFALAIWFGLVLPWYVVNQYYDSQFLARHFLEIGARSEGNTFGIESLLQSGRYLAIGIGKWFKVLIAALGLSVLLLFNKKINKVRSTYLLLSVWGAGFSVFFFSSDVEIWHLLPLYPVVSLFIAFTFFVAIDQLAGQFKKSLKMLTLLLFACLALYQFHQFANLLYAPEPVYSAERDISVKAGKYSNIYLMDVFYPAVVYYSGKNVKPLFWENNAYQQMVHAINEGKDMVFIVNIDTKQQLESDHVKFAVLEQSERYFIIRSEKVDVM